MKKAFVVLMLAVAGFSTSAMAHDNVGLVVGVNGGWHDHGRYHHPYRPHHPHHGWHHGHPHHG